MSEQTILRRIMLRCSRGKSRLFRNNVGAFEDKRGRWIRFGVGGNGGSDLIGWRQHEITPDDIGKVIAIFAALEVKRPGQKLTEDQEMFGEMVTHAGGIFGVATSEDEAAEILKPD